MIIFKNELWTTSLGNFCSLYFSPGNCSFSCSLTSSIASWQLRKLYFQSVFFSTAFSLSLPLLFVSSPMSFIHPSICLSVSVCLPWMDPAVSVCQSNVKSQKPLICFQQNSKGAILLWYNSRCKMYSRQLVRWIRTQLVTSTIYCIYWLYCNSFAKLTLAHGSVEITANQTSWWQLKH